LQVHSGLNCENCRLRL